MKRQQYREGAAVEIGLANGDVIEVSPTDILNIVNNKSFRFKCSDAGINWKDIPSSNLAVIAFALEMANSMGDDPIDVGFMFHEDGCGLDICDWADSEENLIEVANFFLHDIVESEDTILNIKDHTL